MTKLVLTLLALATLSPIPAASQALDVTKVTGSWSGSGSFFKADLQEKAGPIAFVAEFKADHSGTGRVGGATMQDVRVKSRRQLIEIDAKLAGSIGADPALAKDHVVILVTLVNDSTMQGEFHLKSNSIFDPRMREGRMVLTRVK